MNTNVNIVVDDRLYASHAETLDAYGRVFSKKLFIIQEANADPKYDEDVEANRNTLRRPLKIFTTKSIRIVDVKLVQMPDGTLQVRLNADPQLQFPLNKPRMLRANSDTVAEAIANLGVPGAEQIYFTNLLDLNKELSLLNRNTVSFAKAISERLISIADSTENIIAMENAEAISYAKEIEKVKPSIERLSIDSVEVNVIANA